MKMFKRLYSRKKLINDEKSANDTSEIRELIITACVKTSENRDSRNFIVSHEAGLTACYLKNVFYIVDNDFFPLLFLDATEDIVSCSISDNGEYAAFQTAFGNTDYSNLLVFVDVSQKRVVFKIKMAIPTNEKTHIYIDTHKRIVFINGIGTKTKFSVSFDGETLLCDTDIEALKASLKGKSDKESAAIWGSALEDYRKSKNSFVERCNRSEFSESVLINDCEWEKEFNARNKAKAGIVEEADIRESLFDDFIDKEKWEQYCEAPPSISPYYIYSEVMSQIEDFAFGYGECAEELITRNLSEIENNPQMSAYQLSLAYKRLGEAYTVNDRYELAIEAYRRGLRLNPRLPVKSAKKKLEESL